MPLSTIGEQSINTAHTGNVWALFVTINHADLVAPIRFSDLPDEQVRLTNTYLSRDFSVALPEDSQDQLPQLTMSTEDVDRSLDSALTDLAVTTEERPTVTFSVVNMSDLNVDQAGPWTLEVTKHDHSMSGEGSAPVTILSLQFSNLVREAFPGELIRPANMPGQF